MFSTRTGSFPIGFRRGWSEWQKDLAGCLGWAKANGLGVIDLGNDAPTSAAEVAKAGMKVGSADMKDWNKFISAEAATRQAAADAARPYVEACTKAGVRNFFVVMLPENRERKRAENFAFMVEGMKLLAPILEANGGRLVIEGWPGPGALCCSPETIRALFKEVPSKALGLNYDPSHLIRMRIDPIRFLSEFADRVYHVHGKDTEIIEEAVYELGVEQAPTLMKGHGFGSVTWRYTIPGHGQMRWPEAFRILADRGYQGAVCIELEDENFNGSKEGEQAGFLHGARFLAGC